MSLSSPSAAPNIATNYSGWLGHANARVAAFKGACPSERATTYYFSQSGNDSNDGLSELTPKKTRAAAIALSASGRRFRFKRGDTWRESGNWDVGDNITVDAYGTGDKPVFDRFTVQYLSTDDDWGSQSVNNRWQVAETTDVAWVKLSAFPLTRPLQRVADATACDNTNDSWAWVANVLYINLGDTDDPNDFDIDVCPSNDGENGVEFTGDGSRVEDIVFYGWGCSRTTAATQDQGVTFRQTGNETDLAINCECYYSGSHAIATNNPGAAGGRSMMLGCKAGYVKYSASGGETVFNCYSVDGGQECWFIDCECTYGTLPSSDWTPATNFLRSQAFFAHTDGVLKPELLVVLRCTAGSDNAYGPISLFYTPHPADVTASDLTTYTQFLVNCEQFKPQQAVSPISLDFLNYGVMYGNRLSFWPKSGAPNAFDTTAKQYTWLINNYITVDMTTVANNPFSLYNDADPVWEMYWHHNYIELTNVTGTAASRFGIDYFVRAATTAAALGVPGAGSSYLSTFVNNVVAVNKTTGGAVYYLGMTNSSNAKNNALYGITQATGVERGYDLTTSPVVITTPAPVFNTSHADLLAAGNTTLMLSHDINGKRRLVSTPDIGPVDFSSVTPTGSYGRGVIGLVNSRVDAGVQLDITSHN